MYPDSIGLYHNVKTAIPVIPPIMIPRPKFCMFLPPEFDCKLALTAALLAEGATLSPVAATIVSSVTVLTPPPGSVLVTITLDVVKRAVVF